MNYYRTLNEGFDKFVSEQLDEEVSAPELKNERSFLAESRQPTRLTEEKFVVNYSINGKSVNKDKWDKTLGAYDITITADQQKELDAGKEITVKGSDYAGTETEFKLKAERQKIEDTKKGQSWGERRAEKRSDKLLKKSTDASGAVRSDYKLTISQKDGKFPLKLGDKVIAVYPDATTVDSVITILKQQFDAAK